MMAAGQQPLYELAPVNGRGANLQAVYYGYPSLEAFAEDLPAQANVADIGAGISDFGRRVCTIRPDVMWTYFDRAYTSPAILQQAKGTTDTPPNVSFIAGDILKGAEASLEPGSFDRLFSSRLIPHIELESPELACQALRTMGSLLNEDGSMHILQGFYPLVLDRLLKRPAYIRITKQALEEGGNSTIEKAVHQIRLSGYYRWRQIVRNVHATAQLGQSQWRLPDAKGKLWPARGQIWDPDQGVFVSRRSLRGHQIFGGYALRVLRDPFPLRHR